MTKRTTVYLDARIHQAVKVKSAESNVSVSDLINHALKLSLREDDADLQAVDKRKHERPRALGDFIRDLKRDGIL